jgi:hypothetical protein
MSAGHSLHKKDYLMLLGGLGLAATGFGAAGMGPLAGMLGGEAAAGAGAAGAADAAGTAAAITPEAESALGGIDAMQAAGQGGMGVAQNGIGSGTMGNQFAGLLNNPASALSSNGMPANVAKGLLGGASKMAGAGGTAQMGMSLLNPPQRPPVQPGPPLGGGQTAPMPLPYGNPSGNSLNGPPPGMSMEEWLRRKQMMGGMQ